MRELFIDGRRIADDENPYLIAEIGHNHAGDLGKAVQMVDEAIAAGADAVKFQTRNPVELYAPGTAPGAYDSESDNPQWMAGTYGAHREQLEFTPEEWRELFETCRARGITAFSTPFDFSSANLLAGLDVPAFKIASGDATNIPLIKHVASFGKPMIVSTGGCNEFEVDQIAAELGKTETPFALLHCSCIYPAPADILNLNAITTMRDRYNCVIGLSTHSPEYATSIAATALGARIIEHHFTADRDWKGTDNHFSLEPEHLRGLREAGDRVRVALGSGLKAPYPVEGNYTNERRKALYWSKDLPTGHVVQDNDVIAQCPYPDGGALHPYEANKIVGEKLTAPVKAGEIV